MIPGIQNRMIWLIIAVVIFLVIAYMFGGKTYDFIGIPSPDEIHKYFPEILDPVMEGERQVTIEEHMGIIRELPLEPEPLHIDDTPAVPHKFESTKKEEPNNKFESRGEFLCRKYLKEFYPGYEFDNVRPDWLINPDSGRNMELDCYNEELGLALEYNGSQHYVYPNTLHKNVEEFTKQVTRDHYKRDICDRNLVYLISVPYTVDNKKLKEYIEYYLPENYEKRIETERLLGLEEN